MSPLNSNTIGTLENAVNLFCDHEGVNLNKMEKWSDQFGQQNQQLVLKILSNIDYYSGPTIRQMVEKLIELVCTHLQLSDRKKILFVPIGEPYEGSAVIARALRGSRGIHPKQIKHQADLANPPKKTTVRAIVLLDVFSGTGNQLLDWWENNETLLLPWAHKSIKLILGILAVNEKAVKVLKTIPAAILRASYLGVQYNVLSGRSKAFSASEKKLLKEFCAETNCPSEYLYGKGECGLLVAFKHGCPNNSLPILWCESQQWKRLFLRRAL